MSAITGEDPASPCIGVCTLNDRTGLCEGCFRSLAEIAGWIDYSPEQKREVLGKVEERCERLFDDAWSD